MTFIIFILVNIDVEDSELNGKTKATNARSCCLNTNVSDIINTCL